MQEDGHGKVVRGCGGLGEALQHHSDDDDGVVKTDLGDNGNGKLEVTKLLSFDNSEFVQIGILSKGTVASAGPTF